MIPFKDNLLCIARPTVTTLLIILNCLFFIIQQAFMGSGRHYAALVQHHGMYTPANITHAFASADPMAMLFATITMFTAMFLHGGLMHIFGNMVYLNCFGRAVEARLGGKQFIVFYLLAGFAATAGQYFMNPLSEVPNLGASGAIAGVLSAYMMFYPRARIVGVSMQIGIVYAPAWSYLGAWVGMQLFSVIFEHPNGGGGVAYMAHIGGFVFGIIAGFAARWFKTINDVRYPEDVELALKLKKANRKPNPLKRKLVAVCSWLNSKIIARLRSRLTFKIRIKLRFDKIAASWPGRKTKPAVQNGV